MNNQKTIKTALVCLAAEAAMAAVSLLLLRARLEKRNVGDTFRTETE